MRHVASSPLNYYYDSTGYLTAIKYRLTRGDVIGIYSGSGVLTAKYVYDTWGQRVKKTVRRTIFSDERHSRYHAAGGVAVATVRARLPTKTM